MMKKLISLLLALCLALALLLPAWAETHRPHTVYACYNGHEVFGLVDVPEGDETEYWARLTFFLEDSNAFVLLFCPVQPDGTFQCGISANVLHLSIQIVDNPLAMVPGTYHFYDALKDGAYLGEALW